MSNNEIYNGFLMDKGKPIPLESIAIGGEGTGGGFDGEHNDLDGRDANDAHPISAITNLRSELDSLEIATGEPDWDKLQNRPENITFWGNDIGLPISVEGFPWIQGTFQDRSIAAGTTNTQNVTPIFGSGTASMISGDRFIVPETGLYSFVASNFRGSATTGSGVQWISVALPSNHMFIDTQIQAGTSAYFPTLSFTYRFSANQSFQLNLRSTVAQTHIRRDNEPWNVGIFAFARIA